MKMKLFKVAYIAGILFIYSCSTGDKKQVKSDKSSNYAEEKIPAPRSLSMTTYKPSSVCDCSKDGLKTLNDMLAIRQRFQNFKNYNNDYAAVERIANLQDNWSVIRDVCLRTFASKLFNPSDCNRPDKIGYFKDKLNNLGITTN
jgi:hypothetical protein